MPDVASAPYRVCRRPANERMSFHWPSVCTTTSTMPATASHHQTDCCSGITKRATTAANTSATPTQPSAWSTLAIVLTLATARCQPISR